MREQKAEVKTMTGFGEMIFQNGMEQGEKSIVEYMMKTGKYSLEEISAITGVSKRRSSSLRMFSQMA